MNPDTVFDSHVRVSTRLNLLNDCNRSGSCRRAWSRRSEGKAASGVRVAMVEVPA